MHWRLTNIGIPATQPKTIDLTIESSLTVIQACQLNWGVQACTVTPATTEWKQLHMFVFRDKLIIHTGHFHRRAEPQAVGNNYGLMKFYIE